MEYLLGETGGTLTVSPPVQKEEKNFVLPPKNDNMRRVFAYLLNRRGIDREVLNWRRQLTAGESTAMRHPVRFRTGCFFKRSRTIQISGRCFSALTAMNPDKRQRNALLTNSLSRESHLKSSYRIIRTGMRICWQPGNNLSLKNRRNSQIGESNSPDRDSGGYVRRYWWNYTRLSSI